MDFEGNIKQLDSIIDILEAGEISLDKAVELYETGSRIIAECKNQLDSAQIKIKDLTQITPVD